MTIFFTADPHFGHANIIKYCNRPFESAAEMDAAILSRLNAVVREQDTLFLLGDFSMGVRESRALDAARGYRDRIVCRDVRFVWGNHDPQGSDEFAELFSRADHLADVKIAGQRLTLCHYAMRAWNKSHHGSYQLYGHTHGALAEEPGVLNFDVGVDCWNFYPISLDQVCEVMEHKKAGGLARDWTIEGGRLVHCPPAA